MITIALLRQAGVSDTLILRIVELARAEQLASQRVKRSGAGVTAPPRSAPPPSRQPAEPRWVPPPEQVRVVAPAGSQIPQDWQPDMGGIMLADQRGADLALEVRRFVDYYTSIGTRRQDWQATFRCWLNSPYFEAAKRGKNGHERPHFKQWAQAYAELDAYSKGSGRTSWAEATQPVFAPERR